MRCSHPICRRRGVRFRYCLICQRPVAKRNFSSRHSHQQELTAITSGDNAGDTKIANTASRQSKPQHQQLQEAGAITGTADDDDDDDDDDLGPSSSPPPPPAQELKNENEGYNNDVDNSILSFQNQAEEAEEEDGDYENGGADVLKVFSNDGTDP